MKLIKCAILTELIINPNLVIKNIQFIYLVSINMFEIHLTSIWFIGLFTILTQHLDQLMDTIFCTLHYYLQNYISLDNIIIVHIHVKNVMFHFNLYNNLHLTNVHRVFRINIYNVIGKVLLFHVYTAKVMHSFSNL